MGWGKRVPFWRVAVGASETLLWGPLRQNSSALSDKFFWGDGGETTVSLRQTIMIFLMGVGRPLRLSGTFLGPLIPKSSAPSDTLFAEPLRLTSSASSEKMLGLRDVNKEFVFVRHFFLGWGGH